MSNKIWNSEFKFTARDNSYEIIVPAWKAILLAVIIGVISGAFTCVLAIALAK